MPLCAAFGQSISTFTATKSRAIITSRSETRNVRFFSCSAVAISNDKKSKVIHDSLRVLQWDKLCDSVSSFARTSLGRQATQVNSSFYLLFNPILLDFVEIHLMFGCSGSCGRSTRLTRTV